MPKSLPPPAAMFSLIMRSFVLRLVYVAVKLELADHLKHGPRTVEELAKAAEVQPPALYRVLRALASVGIFEETRGKRFKLTPLAATLQRAVPGSMRALALMLGEEYQQEAWAHLLHGLKTGEVPFFKAHGVSFFEYLEKHPEDRRIFGEAMTNVSSTENPAIAAYKFSGIRTLVDVGGGNGSLLATILQANPKLKGVLFDQPSVVAGAKQDRYLTAKGVAERCAFESGDFFEPVPKGGDAYLMKRTLHDWDDQRCAKILANCRAVMNEKGKVLVVESVIPPGNQPDRGKLLDMQMLVGTGGLERTKQEFAAVFKQAGLKLTRVLPTKCPLSIVEGVRA